MNESIKEILVSPEQINKICEKLGAQITQDYKHKPRPILLGLLKGCVPFMSDLMKHIDIPCEVEFMDVKSYDGTHSSGDIKIRMDISVSVKERHIIICEDIVDTGKTLDTVVKLLKHRGAASIEVVTLLDKPEGRIIPFTPKYIGTTIPKVFVVGYGLDYNELFRNLPYVGILKESVYMDKE